MPDADGGVTWPPCYTAPDGEQHQWDDLVPPDLDFEQPPAPGEKLLTYRQLAGELAAAQDLTITEWFERTGQSFTDNTYTDEDY